MPKGFKINQPVPIHIMIIINNLENIILIRLLWFFVKE